MENRIIKSILFLLMVMPFMAFAHTSNMTQSSNGELVVVPILVSEHSQLNNLSFKGFEFSCKQKCFSRKLKEKESFNAIMTESGTLASVLGESIYEIESISVEGPMNEDDFNTLSKMARNLFTTIK